MAIRIVLIDGHEGMRHVLCELFGTHADIDVVGMGEHASEAVDLARVFQPDVLLLSVSRPRSGGIKAVHEVVVEMPQVKVIALSIYEDKWFETKLLEAGVSGYVLTDRAFEDIVDAVRTVAQKKTYVSNQGFRVEE